MKPKYNCNNTLDYAHEFTRMCNTFHVCNNCPLCVCGMSCRVNNITSEHIRCVQAWSDAHPEITLTDKQVEIFKALNLIGYRYIAQDNDNRIFVYVDRPEKSCGIWRSTSKVPDKYVNVESFSGEIFAAIFPFVSRNDTEPLCIAAALEQAEVKRSDSNV